MDVEILALSVETMALEAKGGQEPVVGKGLPLHEEGRVYCPREDDVSRDQHVWDVLLTR